MQDTWRCDRRWMHSRSQRCLDRVNRSPPDQGSNAHAKNQTVDRVKWKSNARDSIAISEIVGDV